MSLIYIAGGIETIYIIVSYIIRYPLILSFLSDSCDSNCITFLEGKFYQISQVKFCLWKFHAQIFASLLVVLTIHDNFLLDISICENLLLKKLTTTQAVCS